MNSHALAILFAATVVGATIQGSVGFGSNLVVAPALWATVPQTMPASAVIAGLVCSLFVLARALDGIDLNGAAICVLAQVPGALIGGLLLRLIGDTALVAAACSSVALGVAISASGRRVTRTPASLCGAGLASGALTTATGVGGPPLALAYQDVPPKTARGTLSFLAAVNGLVALVVLLSAGRVPASSALLTVTFAVPGVAAGLVLSRVVRRAVVHNFRVVLLAICALAVLVMLSRLI